MVLAVVIGVVAVVSLPASAAAQVAIVSLDGEPDRAVENEVAAELSSGGFEVFVGEEVARRVAARETPAPDPEVAKQFSRMTTTMAAGVERFFYKGNEAAIETISPMFDLGMAHPEVLARRPDYADQTFSAGIILIRAYDNLEDDDNKLAVARLLVKTFPSKNASPTTVPPKVIRLLDEQRAKLSRTNTQLSLLPVDAADCTSYINGTPAEPGVAYVAAPNVDYHVRLDCGAEPAPVWSTRVAEGAQALVPVTARDPLRYAMPDGDFATRKVAENNMAAVAYWAGVDIVVGVSRAASSESDGVLLVRLASDGTARWSDGVTERSVKRAVARVFPELSASESPAEPVVETATPTRAGVDVLGVTLAAAGVAGGGIAAFLLLTAQRRSKVLACSNFGNLPEAECAGIPNLEFTADEFESDQRAITIRRVVGWSTLGVGVGLVGYGLFRLLTRRAEPAVALAVSPGFVSVRLSH